MECEPRCAISWLINNRTLQNDQRASIAEIAQPAEGELFASTVSYLRLADGQLLQPDNEIMCRGESNNVGTGSVRSVGVFKTEGELISFSLSVLVFSVLFYRVSLPKRF